MADNQEMLNNTSDEQYVEGTEYGNDYDSNSNSSDSDNNDVTSDSSTLSDDEIANLSDEDFNKWLETGSYKEPSESKETVQEEQTEQEQEQEQEEEVQEEEPEIDYKSAYELIMSPFKANGKEIRPNSLEDVISLMQQGANYTKKMQALAPLRRSAESLAKAGINDDRLAFLIDLHKGNKEAIKKLLKDNNFDPMEIDTEEESNYQTNYNNIASDSDINFQDAILDSTPETLSKMKEVLATWDSESRQRVLSNPEILRGLDWEISNGRYEQAKQILDNERTFGRYKGVSDLDAYIDIVQKIEQIQYQYAMQQQQQLQQAKSTQTTNSSNNKSKAAPSRGKSTPTKYQMTPEQLMDMPEEEFLKLSIKDII